jgi:excisionase family DNA binding protein
MTTAPDAEPWTEARVRALGLHTDVATAASILGIGRSTAYELIRRDEFPIPVHRIGSRLRVPVAPLLSFFSA